MDAAGRDGSRRGVGGRGVGGRAAVGAVAGVARRRLGGYGAGEDGEREHEGEEEGRGDAQVFLETGCEVHGRFILSCVCRAIGRCTFGWFAQVATEIRTPGMRGKFRGEGRKGGRAVDSG